ncbi:MAG: TfoX/Sxy family protein [Marinirhabdus sp.]
MKETPEQLIHRLRKAMLPWAPHAVEKKMFGGTGYMYKGKMCVGEWKGKLMARVVPEKMEETLKMPHVGPMDITGRPMREFVFVAPEGVTTDEALLHFIALGIEHAGYKQPK